VTVVKNELILCSKNPSWKANNFSAIQEIHHTLWNWLVFFRLLYIFQVINLFITSISNISETKKYFHTTHSEVCVSFIGPN